MSACQLVKSRIEECDNCGGCHPQSAEQQSSKPVKRAKGDTEGYEVEQVIENSSYLVHKPEGGSYQVSLSRSGNSCSCPQQFYRRGICKHISLVNEWVQRNDYLMAGMSIPTFENFISCPF